jgi:hypothetical protein
MTEKALKPVASHDKPRPPHGRVRLFVAWLFGPTYAIGACFGLLLVVGGFFSHSPYILPMGVLISVLFGLPAIFFLVVALTALCGRTVGMPTLWFLVAAIGPPIGLFVLLPILWAP